MDTLWLSQLGIGTEFPALVVIVNAVVQGVGLGAESSASSFEQATKRVNRLRVWAYRIASLQLGNTV